MMTDDERLYVIAARINESLRPKHMAEEMPAESVDCAIFSPPFPSLYAYTSSESDIGNHESVNAEAKPAAPQWGGISTETP